MKELFSLILAFQFMLAPVVSIAATQKDSDQSNEIEVGSSAYHDGRSQGRNGYEHFSKQILGASTAIIGSNIISSCKWGAKVPSILTFMGGAITYLISEISGGKKQNEEHKQRLKRIEEIKKQVAQNKGGGDVQRVLIEQRLEEEEKVLAFVKERSQWGKAIMAIYTIAAALSITEEMTGIAAGTAIGMSTCSALAAKYASPCAQAYAACYAKHMAACTVSHPLGQTTAKSAFMSPTSLSLGEAACSGPYVTACQANLKSYAAIAYANCQPLGAGNLTAGVMGKTFTVNLYSAAFGLGLGYTSSGNIQSMLQLAVSLTKLFTSSLATKITALYSYPIPRTAAFGAHAALMAVIISGLNQVQHQTELNVSRLRKLVDQFKKDTDDMNGMQQGKTLAAQENADYREVDLKGQTSEVVSLSKNPKALHSKDLKKHQTKTCLSHGENGAIEVGERACETAINIKPISASLKQNKTPTFEQGVSLINDINKSLNEGDLEKARVNTSQLALMATALRKDLEKIQNDYNAKLPKKERIDFEAATREQLAELEMRPETQDIFDSFQKDHGISLASFGESSNSSSVEQAHEEKVKEFPTSKGGSNEFADAARVPQNRPYEGLTPETDPNILLEENALLYGGDKTSNNPFGLNEDAFRAASANGYLHLHGNKHRMDGVASQKENLFKIISNRYFLSYLKVMRKKMSNAPKTE